MVQVRARVTSIGRGSATLLLTTGREIEVALPEGCDAGEGDLVSAAIEGATARSLRVEARRERAGDDALRWIRPRGGVARVERLRARHAMTRALRALLDDEGFVEIASPVLVPGACPDVHLSSFAVAGGMVLATSTEYQLKRLLVGGIELLYSLTQNFRQGDQGELHNPEFTMLEWARAHATLDDIERDAERLVVAAWRATGQRALTVRGREVRVDEGFERLSVREALEVHLGVRVDWSMPASEMARQAASAGRPVPAGFEQDEALVVSWLIDQAVPQLGSPRPTWLREWPAFMTTSAPRVPGKPEVAERSELFIGGLEVADGFPFLRDGEVQARLFASEAARRAEAGVDAVPIDGRFVDALREGMPAGAGMAMGVDRLAMVMLGASEIREVLAFAFDEL